MFSNIYLEEFMKGLKYFLLLSLASTILLLSAPAANADTYTFVFTNPDQSAVAGDIVEFDATITNLDPSNGLYLNSDNVDLGRHRVWEHSLAIESCRRYGRFLYGCVIRRDCASGNREWHVLG